MSPNACALINIFLILIQICLLLAGVGGLIAALVPKVRKKKLSALLGASALAISFTIPYITERLLSVTPHGPS